MNHDLARRGAADGQRVAAVQAVDVQRAVDRETVGGDGAGIRASRVPGQFDFDVSRRAVDALSSVEEVVRHFEAHSLDFVDGRLLGHDGVLEKQHGFSVRQRGAGGPVARIGVDAFAFPLRIALLPLRDAAVQETAREQRVAAAAVGRLRRAA